MYLDLAPDDRDLLIRLLEARINEGRAEMHRAKDSNLKLRQQEELTAFERLLHRLHEAEYDVRC